MINYYGVFIPRMRQIRAPLDALLKKNVPFNWSEDCQKAFDKAKDVLASPLLLTHFDPNLELIVAADASEYGIGAVILHRFAEGTEKAIIHASRSLTATEKRYGQIEKEGLALVYSPKIPQIPLRAPLHTTYGPQTTRHYLRKQEGTTHIHGQ
ncbi:hypothetical protein Aduo_009044 [Ancylostoma duodenale]